MSTVLLCPRACHGGAESKLVSEVFLCILRVLFADRLQAWISDEQGANDHHLLARLPPAPAPAPAPAPSPSPPLPGTRPSTFGAAPCPCSCAL